MPLSHQPHWIVIEPSTRTILSFALALRFPRASTRCQAVARRSRVSSGSFPKSRFPTEDGETPPSDSHVDRRH